MSLFYAAVFYLLIAEIVIFILLLAPIPLKARKFVVNGLAKNKQVAQIWYFLRIVYGFVVILFLDSINRMIKAQNEHDNSDKHVVGSKTDTFLHAKIFYAQRNIYLTGSVLFLSLILNRFHSMIMELLKNEEKAEVLKKQSAGTSTEYMRLLDKDKENQEKIEELVEELKELKKKSKDTEIVQKQAKQQHDEYLRLADRYNELEKKYERRETNGEKKDE